MVEKRRIIMNSAKLLGLKATTFCVAATVAVLTGNKSVRAEGHGAPRPAAAPRVTDEVCPTVPTRVGGILGERLNLWRQVRLWRVVNDPFFLDGFAHRPGTHPWQGEHVGKWLHAATLACEDTKDAKLAEALQQVVAKLVASQEANGYLGTYVPKKRFYNETDTGDPWTWDIWTHRYVIYGLLRYYDFRDDPTALRAAVRAADLLARTVGPPSGDVTRFGTRHGLSSAVLLESIVMLYERTGDQRYLDFAKHIADSIEGNPQLRIIAAMRTGEDVTAPGDGKAYQLMAVLLGYVELYRCTEEKKYLATAVAAWQKIRAGHLNVAGGPWGYQTKRTTSHECFAPPRYFHPTCCVETCSTVTWIQLCLSLFNLTGEARYADEAEVALFNQLLGAQSPNGNDWAYFSMLNMPDRGYKNAITCCASSGPRALEIYARQLVCVSKDRVVLNSYSPAVVPLDGAGGRRVALGGRLPVGTGSRASDRIALAGEAGGRLPAACGRHSIGSDRQRRCRDVGANFEGVLSPGESVEIRGSGVREVYFPAARPF